VSHGELVLTDQEQWIVEETYRTGNLDLFTNYFMRLPTSGTLWSPGDAIGHYQNWFVYDRLHEAWRPAGPKRRYPSSPTTQAHQSNLSRPWRSGRWFALDLFQAAQPVFNQRKLL